MNWKLTATALIASSALFSTGCEMFSSDDDADMRSASAYRTTTSYEQGVNLSSSDGLGFEIFGVIELQPDRLAALQTPRAFPGEDIGTFGVPQSGFAEVETPLD